MKIEDDKIKTATLLSLVGTNTYKLVRDLCFRALPDTKSFKELNEMLSEHYGAKKSVWKEKRSSMMRGKKSRNQWQNGTPESII